MSVRCLGRATARHRLVEEQEPRVAGERHDDLELALRAVGQMAHLDLTPIQERRLLEQVVGLSVAPRGKR